ncbi:hypothetical protein [Deinococcus peraridilitoris]|uniref:Uncharacterized protein n=1 Tax=Deinococcus peraridilitoris (strain DSM 19664 / LMG 22246 / CIP 109416 / KR-200) TaxID=937777 RepID=L0A8M4_DEIPD|nr:hypothetical protein [Deinococcus peraridilitoris]AFZ69769.1 hypothetical protein Deipe_4441 [Deinococcus peraridilitoris DSM 19664]
MTLTPAQRGQRGGQRSVKRHGHIHMESIGRQGFHTTVERDYAADVRAYMAALRKRQGNGVQLQNDPRLLCPVAAA